MKVRNSKGFTGVDIAVSTVILIVFISIITTMFYNLSVTTKKIERKTTATNLAIQTIEAMKIIEFDKLTQTMTIDEINNLIEKKIEIPNGYEIEVAVDNTTYPDVIKIISAQVNYQSGKTTDNVKIETLVKNTIVTVGDATVESIRYEKNGTGYRITLNNIQYVDKYSLQYKESSESKYKTVGTELTATNYSFDVDKYGLYYIKVKDNSTNVAKRPEIVVSVYENQTFNTETTKITMVKEITETEVETAQVTVPKGFTISGVDNECAQTIVGTTIEKKYTINYGVVITDGTSEFVWVPVPDINKMVMCKQHSETSDCNIVLNETKTELKCKVHNSTEICGKLYATTYGNNFNSSLTSQTYTQNSGLREPDLVTDYDNNTSYNNGLFTLESLNNDFKEMSVNVAKYKGFYISRYEMSLTGATNTEQGTGTAQSVANVMSSTSVGTNTKMWYGLYSKAKTYTVSSNSVTSQMIWGSQYDAMMNWMSSNGIAVTSTASSTNLDITGERTEVNTSRVTGSVAKDRLCNVFDLFGNTWEFTQEAYSTNNRVARGGRSGVPVEPSYRVNGLVIDRYHLPWRFYSPHTLYKVEIALNS